jgi:striatin 1/3/4
LGAGLADEIASQDKPHNSFLVVEGDGEGDGDGEGEKLEDDPDRGTLKDFMDKTQGELTYLMVSPSNPLPPREAPLEEMLQPPTFGVPQQSLEEIYQQQARQKSMRDPNPLRPSPAPNHHPPPVPTNDALAIRNADAPARSLAEQQPLPQSSQQEWSSFQITDQPPEDEVTKVNHSYDQYGRPIETEESEKEPPTEADGWNFDETASFPEPETKAVSQRPDTDVFPTAQDPPKSPVRGPGSHRRKGSMSRRKSAEQELSLHPTQKVDSGTFNVRFGLRGHLDAVRTVIFTGGGSPGEPEICTAGDDGTIKRWIIPARYENQGGMHGPNDMDITSYFTHRGHTGVVMCLTAWSPSQNFSSGGRAQGDGWIFSGGQDATVRVWERGRVDPKATLDGHTDAVWTVCVLPGTAGAVFGPNNTYGGPDRILLVTGAADGTVKVWSVSAPPQLISPQGAGSGRRGGRVRGNSMSSGSAFPSSPQPSVASNSPFHYTLIHSISRANSEASPTCITPLSASGDAFVVSYSDAAVLAYDTRTGEEVAAMASLETYNNTVATGVNAIVATTNGLDGSLSFNSGRSLSEDEGVVGGATGSSGGVEGIIISGHEDRYIRFYDANSGKFPSCPTGCVTCANRNHSGQCTYNMLAHPAAISALSLSPDGRELVSAGHDASLRFWSLEKRSCTQEITSHRLMRGEGVCSVVWSQDGRWVVSGGGDGVVKVFAR